MTTEQKLELAKETLNQILGYSTYNSDPELTSENSMGNYDDVFADGEEQAYWVCSNLAGIALKAVEG